MAKKNVSQNTSSGQYQRGSSEKFLVREANSGRYVEVRGANSMSPSSLTIKKGVDLTKPIAAQALRGEKANDPSGKVR